MFYRILVFYFTVFIPLSTWADTSQNDAIRQAREQTEIAAKEKSKAAAMEAIKAKAVQEDKLKAKLIQQNPKAYECPPHPEGCGEYISKKITSYLVRMKEFQGQKMVLKIHLTRDAFIDDVEIMQAPDDMEFGKYVLFNIRDTGQFDNLLKLEDKDFQQMRNVILTLQP